MSQFEPNPSSAVAVANAIREKGGGQVSECQCCDFLNRGKSSTKDWADYTILKLAQAKYSTDKPITLLDVGSGHGASVLHTAALLAKHGYDVNIQLCEPSLQQSEDPQFPRPTDPNPINAEFVSQYDETIEQLNKQEPPLNGNQVGKVVLSGRYATLLGMKYALLKQSNDRITLDAFVAENVKDSPWRSQDPEQEKRWLKESIEADLRNNPNPSKCDVATFVDLDDAYKPLTDWMKEKENYETLVNSDGWMFGLTKSTLPGDRSPSIFRQMYQFSNPKHSALKQSVTPVVMDQLNVSSQVLALDEQILPVLFAGVKPLEVINTRRNMQGLSVAKFKPTFGMYFRHHGVENVKYFLLGLTVIFPLVVTGLYLYRLFAPSSDAPQRNPQSAPRRSAAGSDSVSAVSMSSWTLYYEHCAHVLSGSKPKYLADEKEQRATEQQRQRLGL